MKIILATNNPNKLAEIQAYFKGLAIEPVSLAQLIEGVLKEEGNTLRENALQKARRVANRTGLWALADDTGLFVEALGGRPGVFSSRYAGTAASYSDNIKKLLAEMKDLPEEARGAYFSCVIALVAKDGREVTVEGRLEGEITREPRGRGGFGYDPIFFLPDRRCTLAELSLAEKNSISHRGRALFKMKGVLEGLVKLENSMRK